MKGVIVLGMGRSGTSLIADLVHRWGAYVGEQKDLLPADEGNPQGYWEPLPLVDLNLKLLASVRSSLFVPPLLEADAELRALAKDPMVAEPARRLLEPFSAGGTRVWLWKDPSLSLLLPFWQEIWPDVVYVIALRNPLEVARSVSRWMRVKSIQGQLFPFAPPAEHVGPVPMSACLLMWQMSMLATLRGTSQATRIVVDYEKLLASPGEGCRRLSDFLDAANPGAGVEGRVEKMAARIQSSIRQHKEATSFLEYRQATVAQKNVYRYFKALEADPHASPDSLDYSPDPCWRDYLCCWGALLNSWNMIPDEKRRYVSRVVADSEFFGF